MAEWVEQLKEVSWKEGFGSVPVIVCLCVHVNTWDKKTESETDQGKERWSREMRTGRKKETKLGGREIEGYQLLSPGLRHLRHLCLHLQELRLESMKGQRVGIAHRRLDVTVAAGSLEVLSSALLLFG